MSSVQNNNVISSFYF